MSKKNKLPKTTEEENYLGNKVLIFSAAFALTAAFLMSSCGARKVNKTEVEKTEKTEQSSVSEEKSTTDTNVKKEVVVVENTKDSTITETVEIRPIDNTKPAYFYQNGKIESISNAYFNKTKTYKSSSKLRQENSVLDESMSKKEDNSLKSNVLVESKIKQLDKQVDRKSSFIGWWLLIIPVALLVMAWRKYKNQIWWI